MEVTSTSYADGDTIPLRHATSAAGGEDVSIGLAWTGAPAATRSYAVATIDVHPVARGWVHWLVVDIPGSVPGLPEGASGTAAMPAGAHELASGYGRPGWGGPQPPPGSGVHDYVTTVFALDVARLPLGPGARLEDVRAAMGPHVLASAQVTGRFER